MKKLYFPYCGQPVDEGCRCEEYAAEDKRLWMDEYKSRPDVCYGWSQQDIIDVYRRER